MRSSALSDHPRSEAQTEVGSRLQMAAAGPYATQPADHQTLIQPTARVALRPARGMSWAAWMRSLLPLDVPLDEDSWRSRHRLVLALLWLHAIGFMLNGIIVAYGSPAHGLHLVTEALVVTFLAAVASTTSLKRGARSVAATLGLLTSSALLVHLSAGRAGRR